MLDEFIALSKILTGRIEIERDLADTYMLQVASLPNCDLSAVLKAYISLVEPSSDPVAATKTDLFGNEALASTVKQIVLLWFTGCTEDSAGNLVLAGAQPYANALMWSAIGSNPPGFSSESYGYWGSPPFTESASQ